MVYFTFFEVAWFDLGSGPVSDYIYDYEEAAREVAREFEGRVVSRENRSFGKHTGLLVKLSDSQNLLGSLLMLRVGNRVYLVSVMNYEVEEQAAADRFINSFKLLDAGPAHDPWKPYRNVGNTWTQRTTFKVQGMDEQTTYARYEVLSVGASSATVRFTNLDGNMKETYQSEMEIRFDFDPHAPAPHHRAG
jgi:hypothetical protein